ncbi:hypothetical protein ASPNIDRAFT_40385, partial [Aspergillus niger ATCC 1015]
QKPGRCPELKNEWEGGGGREGDEGSELGGNSRKAGRGRQITFRRDEEWEPLVRRADGASLKRPPPSEFKGYYQTWASRIDSEHGPVLFPKSSHRERVGSGEQRLALVQLGRLELREFKYPGPGSFSSTQKAVADAAAQDDAGFGTCWMGNNPLREKR